MDKTVVAGGATVFAGCLVAMQAPINSMLGKSIGNFASATMNFAVGLTILIAITLLFAGGYSQLAEGKHLAWYYWVGGGMIGSVYVSTVLISVRHLGAAGTTAATITGQLAMSVVIDRLGLLGIPETPLSLTRVAGVALLVTGTILVVR